MTAPAAPLPEPWLLPQAPDHSQVQHLAAALGLPVLVAQILCLRGYATVEDARKFLEPRLGVEFCPLSRSVEVCRGLSRSVE